MNSIDIFKHSAYILYRYPILFLLPSIGSVISIVSEAFFVIGLHNNNNNQNYFPFSDIFVLFLFFISFMLAYFQLVFVARKIISKTAFENKNYYNVIIFELLIIYSFYALTLADIGGYKSDVRGRLASVKTDRFSMYISKISIHNDTLLVTLFLLVFP